MQKQVNAQNTHNPKLDLNLSLSLNTIEKIRNKDCSLCKGCDKVKWSWECKKHCQKWLDLKFKETARAARMGLVKL